VSSKFASFLKDTLKSGDRFVLEHEYKISGKYLQLPDNFTLEGANGGGLKVMDSSSNPDPLLLLGHRNTIKNVTISHPNSPDTGTDDSNPKRGIDYHNKRTIAINNKDDVTILDSKFEGNVSILLDVSGGKRLTLDGAHFEGAFYQVRLMGNNLDTTVQDSLFANSLGDGIKTERANGYGPQRVTIDDTVFKGNNRDGIDTAGGFKDSVISNSVFRDNGVSGIDIKAVIEKKTDLSHNQMSKNIHISGSEFIDNQNHIVFTTLNSAGLLNKSNANKWSVQNVYIKDNLFEKTADYGGGGRAFLVKESHSIYWDNIKLLGGAEELRTVTVYNLGLNHTLVGTNVTSGPARATSTLEAELDVGPVSSMSAPIDDRMALDAGDATNRAFEADTFHFSGRTDATNVAITATSLEEVHQSERNGNLSYSVQVESDLHHDLLEFAEAHSDKEVVRMSDARAGSDRVIEEFDVYRTAGGRNIVHDRAGRIELTEDSLDPDVTSLVDNAKLSGIEFDYL
jgi:hypothetical protein